MNNQAHAKNYKAMQIGFLEGRPERYMAINDEDIANLKIALNTANSLDEFLQLT